MLADHERQAIIDNEHLKLLSIGYMVSAGMTAFFSLFGLMYAFMGIFMFATISKMPDTSPGQNGPPPEFIGWLFGTLGFLFFAFGIAFAALNLHVAFCLKKRKSRTLCNVIAAISCLWIPYGTLLGVFSFLVLGRPSVIAQFNGGAHPAGNGPAMTGQTPVDPALRT